MYRTDHASSPFMSAGLQPKAAAHEGWHARLELAFAQRGSRTVLVHRTHAGPLAVQKPLYPEGDAICHAVIVHPPGGLAAGDTLAMDLRVQPGAHALLTTPGATKWYKSTAERPSSQRIHITLEESARVDWLPQDNIYFDGSHAHQQLIVRLAAGATAMGWDHALLGRRASGERWQHACLRALTRLIGANGRPLWEERQVLRSGDTILDAPQGLAGLPAYGAFWCLGPACTPELAQMLAPDLPCNPRLRVGATALPGGVLLIRGLAVEPETLRTLFARLWLRLRPLVHGVQGHPLRLWAT